MVLKIFYHKISLLNFSVMKNFFLIFLCDLEKEDPYVLLVPVSRLVALARGGLKIFSCLEHCTLGASGYEVGKLRTMPC